MLLRGFPPILLANLTAWLTPIWLFGLGCLAGLVLLLLLYGLARLVAPRVAEIAAGTWREGFVFPVLCLAGGLGAFALVSLLLSLAGVGYLPLADIGRSLSRLPMSNHFSTTITVPALPIDQRDKPQEFPLPYRSQEMRGVEITSDQDLKIYLRNPFGYSSGRWWKRSS